MPNYCSNLLAIPVRPGVLRAHIETIVRSLRGPNGPLDFTRILPIPPALQDIHRGGQRIGGAYHSHWRETPNPEGSVTRLPIYPPVLARYRREYGADCPLDWCIRHWGTKWNAETWGADWDFNAIRFDTAWSPPLGFVQALSQRFPDTQIELCFVEPGCEINGRVIYYRGEEWQSENYAMDSDAGRENAERVGMSLPEPEDEPETVEV